MTKLEDFICSFGKSLQMLNIESIKINKTFYFDESNNIKKGIIGKDKDNNEDLENLSTYREKFDISTSRAVANLATLSEYLLPLVKENGKCICMKGSNIEEELKNSKNAVKILGGNVDNIDEFLLPHSDIKRNIIIIKKEKKTPNKYPRKPGTPAKDPII